MGASVYLRNKLAGAVCNNTSFAVAQAYMSLHTADGGASGSNEVTGGSYARQAVSFAAESGGAADTDADVSFTGMPAGTISHFGFWDADTAGNWLGGDALNASRTLVAGDTYTIPAGDATFSVT